MAAMYTVMKLKTAVLAYNIWAGESMLFAGNKLPPENVWKLVELDKTRSGGFYEPICWRRAKADSKPRWWDEMRQAGTGQDKARRDV